MDGASKHIAIVEAVIDAMGIAIADLKTRPSTPMGISENRSLRSRWQEVVTNIGDTALLADDFLVSEKAGFIALHPDLRLRWERVSRKLADVTIVADEMLLAL